MSCVINYNRYLIVLSKHNKQLIKRSCEKILRQTEETTNDCSSSFMATGLILVTAVWFNTWKYIILWFSPECLSSMKNPFPPPYFLIKLKIRRKGSFFPMLIHCGEPRPCRATQNPILHNQTKNHLLPSFILNDFFFKRGKFLCQKAL